jgi:hypothetical protein
MEHASQGTSDSRWDGQYRSSRQAIQHLLPPADGITPRKSWVANFGVAIRTNACISSAWRARKPARLCPLLFVPWPMDRRPGGGIDRLRLPFRVMLNQQGFAAVSPCGATRAGDDPRYARNATGKGGMPPMPRRRPRAKAWWIATEDVSQV